MGRARAWVDFVGNATYSERLFLNEAMLLGFNRRTGNHVPAPGDYIIFARWKGEARAFALGVVTGYSFFTSPLLMNARIAAIQERLRREDVSQEEKQLLKRLYDLLDKLMKSIEAAKGAPAKAKVERGCGSYDALPIPFDPKEFYEILRLMQAAFGSISPFSVFASGSIIAYAPDGSYYVPLPMKFSRGMIRAKKGVYDAVVKNGNLKAWKVLGSESFKRFLLLSALHEEGEVILLEDYKHLHHRRAEEKEDLLNRLGLDKDKGAFT
jgi:hypothetical protein